nr:MAG TPA: Nuclease [Caudoviricetes sp.]
MAVESTIVASILTYLNGLQGCQAEKTHGSAMSSGKADIYACYKGRFIRLEVKTSDHGNKASKKQLINLRRWRSAGAICAVVYSLEEVKNFISELEEDTYGN